MQKCLCKKVIYLKKATLIISIRHRVYCFVTINAIDQVVLVYTVGTRENKRWKSTKDLW